MSDKRARLVEPGIKDYTKFCLKKCNLVKQKYNNIIINVVLLLVFISLICGFLYYKYKGKLSPLEKLEKEKKKKEYIFSKIKLYQDIKKQSSLNLANNSNWVADHNLLNNKILK